MKRNVAGRVSFRMISSADHFSSKTGETVTVQVGIGTAAFQNATNTPATEKASGFYNILLTAAERNASFVDVKCSSSGADTQAFCLYPEASSIADVVSLIGTPAADVSADIAAVKAVVDITDWKVDTVDSNVDSILVNTDAKTSTRATVAALAVTDGKVDTLTTNLATVDGIVDIILALVGVNNRVFTPVYNANRKLTSCTIKGYPTAADVDLDTNDIIELDVTATYTDLEMQTFKIEKV